MGTDVATAKGRATRDRIVAAAGELMHRHGVAGTGMPDVRVAAAVSSSQIYHYFADKDALTRAVLDWWAERVVAAQVASLACVDDVAGLRRWRDEVVADAGDHLGCPLGVLTTELAGEDWARRVGAAGFRRWQDALRDALARVIGIDAVAAGVDPASRAVALLAVVQGGLLLSRVTGSTTSLATALDDEIDALTQLRSLQRAPRRVAGSSAR